jgi:hypothetical protein
MHDEKPCDLLGCDLHWIWCNYQLPWEVHDHVRVLVRTVSTNRTFLVCVVAFMSERVRANWPSDTSDGGFPSVFSCLSEAIRVMKRVVACAFVLPLNSERVFSAVGCLFSPRCLQARGPQCVENMEGSGRAPPGASLNRQTQHICTKQHEK